MGTKLRKENYDKRKPDVIICSETWLKVPPNQIRLDG